MAKDSVRTARGRSGPFSLPAVLFLAVLLGLAGLPGRPDAADAVPRLALVIGNGKYAEAPLRNPENDAALMAETLRSVGFDVFEHHNADRRELTKAFHAFADRLDEAGKDSVALIYYAGHGAQLRGENYLIPVDARIEEQLDIEIEGVRASSLLETLNQTGNRLNIVIFDACRNNPFVSDTRSASRGLARMDAPTGTLLAYSTAPGRTAVDGDGRNSPYTRALARTILAEGLKVEEVFKRVRISVMERTDEQQIPWESSSLTGDFYFVPPSMQAAAADVLKAEIAHWKRIDYGRDPGVYRDYLDQYPQGAFADLARERIAALAQEGTVMAAEPSSTQLDVSPQQTPAPEPQTAALTSPAETASAHPYDGIWRFTYAATAAFRRTDFCRKGETVDTRLHVSRGRIEAQLDSNILGTAYLIGSVDRAGNVDLTLKGKEWPGAAKIIGNAGSGRIEGAKAGLACHGEYTLTRVGEGPPAPQTGAGPDVQAGPRSYDGRYRLAWKLIGAYDDWEFCRAGEEADAEVVVRDGKFSADVTSNKGGHAVFDGTVSEGGFLLGQFKARQWSRHRAVAGNLALGSISAKAYGKTCHSEYVLSHVGPLDGEPEREAAQVSQPGPVLSTDR